MLWLLPKANRISWPTTSSTLARVGPNHLPPPLLHLAVNKGAYEGMDDAVPAQDAARNQCTQADVFFQSLATVDRRLRPA